MKMKKKKTCCGTLNLLNNFKSVIGFVLTSLLIDSMHSFIFSSFSWWSLISNESKAQIHGASGNFYLKERERK